MTMPDVDPTVFLSAEPTAEFVGVLMQHEHGQPISDQASAGIYALVQLDRAETTAGVSFWSKKLSDIENGDQNVISDMLANRALSRKRDAARRIRIAALEAQLFSDES